MAGLVSLKATHGIHASSSRTPHKVAVRHGDRFVTYKQLVDRMRAVTSAALHTLQPFNRVAILSNNSIEYLELLFGLADAGIAVVTINPKSSSKEVVAALYDSDTKVLFVEESLHRREYTSCTDILITINDEYKSWLSKNNKPLPLPLIDDNSIFNIIYSSGTTGAPKGICIPHRTRVMTSLLMVMGKRNAHDDVMFVFASLAYGGGNVPVLATLFNGGTLILATNIHPENILRTIQQYKVTCLYSVPVLTYMLLNSQRIHKYDISSLRSFVSVAAPFSVDLKQKALSVFGNIVYDVFASTECGWISTLTPAMMNSHPSSVGLPVAGCTVRIQREDGTEAEPNEVGEIFSNTLTMFLGYLHSDPVNEFVSVGDLGYKDQDGYLYIVGRKGDMIITGGYNVHPQEVESVLNTCPGITESAVVGIPDEKWGEVVTAFIVGAPEIDPLIHCRNSLASYKIPRKIFYIDSIPKSEVGKILRKDLRKSYK